VIVRFYHEQNIRPGMTRHIAKQIDQEILPEDKSIRVPLLCCKYTPESIIEKEREKKILELNSGHW
jgi:hypothetical protein